MNIPPNVTALDAAPAMVSERQMANAIRALSMDAIERANSGHPGMPLGMADVATVLFTRFLKFDAAAPDWPDRDRFVLSAGHGSMLQYALLYLTGYPGMGVDDIKAFRQFGSITAGHPEYGHTTGVETTTGPLGQGIANALGMALAERLLNARYGDDIVDHYTYAIAGDGCLMEGISHEAISLAGHLRLARLIVLFDDNKISIDGPTDLSVSDDQLARFAAGGWDVAAVDGHDMDAVAAAIAAARNSDAPSLIACRTLIGFGAPNKQGTSATHGAPLGAEEIAAARKVLDWPHEPFDVPDIIRNAWREAGRRGAGLRAEWERAAGCLDDIERERLADPLPAGDGEALSVAVRELVDEFIADKPTLATRVSSKQVLERLVPVLPALIGGSADLTGSNGTLTAHHSAVAPGAFAGNYLHYGVREHAMAAAMNGMALHGGILPYGGTFLVFSDYCRPAIRLAALMGTRVIHVMTHDSIGLGEDGPTHQPVEHVASLRAIPNVQVFRPADAVEVAECWELALTTRDAPSILCLTRQGVPVLRGAAGTGNASARGGYLLRVPEGERDVTLIATGSEVALAVEAADALRREGVAAAVVSIPCHELFAAQGEEYRASVLGSAPRIATEAGVATGWRRWLGDGGTFIGMTGFGASAPAPELFEHFGITTARVIEAARAAVSGR